MTGPHLADSTVWSKVRNRARPELADWFNAEVRADRIWTCEVVALELLRSARNAAAFSEQSVLLGLLRSCPITQREWARARRVQSDLARRGSHRGVPPADLLIAAAAETAGVALLHYDHDYDLIGSVTGQSTRWLAPAGSIP
ncbi:MAG: PIN domain-containing protein [Egibacteraceae bacterium]